MGVAESNPANGSEIAVAPDELTITFTVGVELDSAAAELRYVGGPDTPITEVANKDLPADPLTKTSGTGQGSTATFDLPTLTAGLYAVDWTVNEIGGHSNNSMIVFRVTESRQSNAPVLATVVSVLGIVGVTAAFLAFRKKKQ
jgi:methionine-rich copper-binding protein CopC